MGKYDELVKAMRESMKELIPVQTAWGTAENVGEQTMTVADADEPDVKYYNVLLGLDGMIIQPKDGSRVLIGIIENNENAAFLIHASQWKSCKINGDQHGGLTIADRVTERLNAIEQKFNAYMDFEDSLPVAVANAVSAPPAPGVRTQFKMASTESVNLQNETVKHG